MSLSDVGLPPAADGPDTDCQLQLKRAMTVTGAPLVIVIIAALLAAIESRLKTGANHDGTSRFITELGKLKSGGPLPCFPVSDL